MIDRPLVKTIRWYFIDMVEQFGDEFRQSTVEIVKGKKKIYKGKAFDVPENILDLPMGIIGTRNGNLLITLD